MRSTVTSSAVGGVALLLTATLLAGCGGETPPAEAAPELADRLALVDRAVVSGDETSIRRRVESLVAATESARDDGSIDEAQANRILTSAEALLERLPQEPPPEPSPSPTASSTPLPVPEGDEGDEDEGHEEDKGGKGNGGEGPGLGHGHGKAKGDKDKDKEDEDD